MGTKFVALPGAQGINLALVTRWAAGPHPEKAGDWALEIHFVGDSTPTYFTGDAANKLLAALADLAGLNLPGDAATFTTEGASDDDKS